MSVEAIAIALHHSRAKGAAKLVLIGIANHAGDGGAWPSMSTLAKYASCNLRNARAAVVALEALKEVERIVMAGGDESTADHMRPNLYKFKLKCPSSCDGTTRHRTRDEASLNLDYLPPVAGDRGVVGDRTPRSWATSEPSFNQIQGDREETDVLNRGRAHEEAERQSRTTLGNVSDIAAARGAAGMPREEVCRGRAGIHPHEFNTRSGWCRHCETRQPETPDPRPQAKGG